MKNGKRLPFVLVVACLLAVGGVAGNRAYERHAQQEAAAEAAKAKAHREDIQGKLRALAETAGKERKDLAEKVGFAQVTYRLLDLVAASDATAEERAEAIRALRERWSRYVAQSVDACVHYTATVDEYNRLVAEHSNDFPGGLPPLGPDDCVTGL